MKECLDCEYRGYSPEFCRVHVRSCKARPENERKPLPRSVKVGASTLAWAGLGVAAVCVSFTAVSLVGGVALLHTELIRITAGAGLAGGGVGLCRSLLQINGKADLEVQDKDGRDRDSIL